MKTLTFKNRNYLLLVIAPIAYFMYRFALYLILNWTFIYQSICR